MGRKGSYSPLGAPPQVNGGVVPDRRIIADLRLFAGLASFRILLSHISDHCVAHMAQMVFGNVAVLGVSVVAIHP